MIEVYTNEGTIIKGDRITCEARKISDIQVIAKSGRHKAQRIILRDNAMCLIDKKLKFIKQNLNVLGVYIPVNGGTEKNLFWKKFLDYTEKNIDENVLMIGDFNSCTKEDSANRTDYNPNDLINQKNQDILTYGSIIQ